MFFFFQARQTLKTPILRFLWIHFYFGKKNKLVNLLNSSKSKNIFIKISIIYFVVGYNSYIVQNGFWMFYYAYQYLLRAGEGRRPWATTISPYVPHVSFFVFRQLWATTIPPSVPPHLTIPGKSTFLNGIFRAFKVWFSKIQRRATTFVARKGK